MKLPDLPPPDYLGPEGSRRRTDDQVRAIQREAYIAGLEETAIERDALQTNHDKMTRMHAERTVQRDVYRDKMDAAILRQG